MVNNVTMEKTPGNKQISRKIYLDIIRIVAIFLVLYTHISADGLRLYKNSDDLSIQIPYLFIDCFRTINNPLLFMVSGVLLLGKEEPIGVVWKRRILRFTIVLVVFSYIHVLDNCIQSSDFTAFNPVRILASILNGPVRTSYWYLYSYISFLIMLPFLRMIAKAIKPKDAIYLLLICTMALDGFRLLKTSIGVGRINFSIYFCEMTIFYPLLGYAIDKYWDEVPWKKGKYIFLGSVSLVGITAAMLMTMREHAITQGWTENWITLFNTFMASFVFVLLRRVGGVLQERYVYLSGIIHFLSGTMFGIYLLENVFRRWTRPLYLYFYTVMPLIPAVVLWIVSIMLVGNIVIGILKCVPGVKKYI